MATEQAKHQEMPEQIVIKVTLDNKTNQIRVEGPIHIKELAVKMLTNAINVVMDHQPPVIIPAKNLPAADRKPLVVH